jgi:uncharacterized membrane protein
VTAHLTDDRALESLLANVLHYGTALAMVVIALGVGMTTLGDPAPAQPAGTTVVAAGLALLIMLPVVRVALMLIVFALGREYVLAATAGFVLLIILIGLLIGTHGHPRSADLTRDRPPLTVGRSSELARLPPPAIQSSRI